MQNSEKKTVSMQVNGVEVQDIADGLLLLGRHESAQGVDEQIRITKLRFKILDILDDSGV